MKEFDFSVMNFCRQSENAFVSEKLCLILVCSCLILVCSQRGLGTRHGICHITNLVFYM